MDCSLLVDIGNSSISWGINQNYTTIPLTDFQQDLIPQHKNSFISCVANHELINSFNRPKIFTPKTYKNLLFTYNLNQIGTDRFLAIIAAHNKFLHSDLMVVDIGTFITIDYIKNNTHISGGIAPGINKLQVIKTFSGADSKNAWLEGTTNMLTNYIMHNIKQFEGKILITGGGKKLVKLQKEHISHHQNLVLDGLQIINEKE